MIFRTSLVSCRLVIAGLVVAMTAGSAAIAQTPGYVGSQSCAACHENATAAWEGSHHDLAWTEPGEATLADFDGTNLVHDGTLSEFSRTGDRYAIRVTEKDGSVTDYDVQSVAGIEPLQQYLIETEEGRLQSFDVVWDTDRARWYHLYPDQELYPRDGLHWTGPYKSWNARCAECHATGYEKNFDPQTGTYASSQAEIGVGCEACHGPGEAHLDWARTQSYDAARFAGLTDTGLTLAFDGDAETEIQQCAGCHSRREAFEEGNPLPGTAFHDAYRLSLIRPGSYHADGTILDEVYVYGSFLQSKMYDRGVQCSDCHDVHSAKLKFDGNTTCTQCHSPAGNPEFPTLAKLDYDTPDHHFHAPDSEGAQCKSCHMVERVYMGVDGRRDHSFRIPRPDLSDETGAPNACTDCHADQPPGWAAAEIAARFPDDPARGRHFSQVLARGWNDPAATASALLALAADDTQAGIIRASALDAVAPVADAGVAARSVTLLSDADPLIRVAAVSLQRGAEMQDRVARLAPLLGDPVRSVRMSAARELLSTPMDQLPRREARALQSALGEWQASISSRLDFPETHLVLGGVALVLRDPQAALRAFDEVVTLDPQQAQGWIMLMRINMAIGDVDTARKVRLRALAAVPDDPALREVARGVP